MDTLERKTMPRGIRGYRWIETGCKVFGLEDSPRHFLGYVSVTCSPDCWNWFTSRSPDSEAGYAETIRGAKAEVERRVIPKKSAAAS
jgi:hypothetical protein